MFSLTFQPASLRSAVILGDPYVPRWALNSRATSKASAARRSARSGSTPGRHL